MPHSLVRVTVESFDKWKEVFDQNNDVRTRAGVSSVRAFRSDENPNEVSILMEWPDVETARTYATSPELREIMQRAGVVGKPDVVYLEELKLS